MQENAEPSVAISDRASERRQLTLFVPAAPSAVLEAVRQRVDPVQHSLIAAHVTLCRDEDFASFALDEVLVRLQDQSWPTLLLRFGAPETFDGHGVLLPCIDGESDFHRLRQHVLGARDVRRHHAHITLAHPRNPRASENHFTAFSSLSSGMCITFEEICLIEQRDHAPWEILARFPSRGAL